MQINWPFPRSQSNSSTHSPAAVSVGHQVLDPTHDDRSNSRHNCISSQTQGERVRGFTCQKTNPSVSAIAVRQKRSQAHPVEFPISQLSVPDMISFDAFIASARPDSLYLKQFHNDSRPGRLQPSITCDYQPEILLFFSVTIPADQLIRCCEVITAGILPRQSDAPLRFEHPFSAELLQSCKHADWNCSISIASATVCVSCKHPHREIIPLKCFLI